MLGWSWLYVESGVGDKREEEEAPPPSDRRRLNIQGHVGLGSKNLNVR